MDWQRAAERLYAELNRAFNSEFAIRDSEFGIAVACSGGADSLAALLLVWAAFPEAREKLCVLHYDHAIREDSAEDAVFVREICKNLGAEFVCERRNVSVEAHSEGALRALRLDFFKREMSARKIRLLVQGHQRDDIAENMLMRLTRGAGAEGLAAPRKISRQSDGRIFVRPLLNVPKEKILAALQVCGIPWREDATNAGTDYFRNRVRNCVLPELRAVAPFENIARSRMLLEEDADALNFFADEILKKSGEDISFKNLPKAVVRRVLQKIFSREEIRSDGAAIIDSFVEAVAAETPKKTQVGGKDILWDGTCLRIQSRSEISVDSSMPRFSREKVEITESLFEQIRAGAFSPSETVFLAGTPEIFVRTLLPGEKYRPLGAPGEKLVRRMLTDKKIPRNVRAHLPVFADGTGIAWIPGLPPAERFRVREAGTAALRLTYRDASLV